MFEKTNVILLNKNIVDPVVGTYESPMDLLSLRSTLNFLLSG